MERKCLICGGHEHEIVFTEFAVDVLRCPCCGLRLYSRPMTCSILCSIDSVDSLVAARPVVG